MKLESVNTWEVVKYIAIVATKEEIEELSLQNVIPKRTTNRGRKPTINFLKSDKTDAERWIPTGVEPDQNQQRALVALALAHCVEVVMTNHTYKLGDKVYLQSDGGPIGLEATGAVARAVMMMYDSIFQERVKEAGITQCDKQTIYLRKKKNRLKCVFFCSRRYI